MNEEKMVDGEEEGGIQFSPALSFGRESDEEGSPQKKELKEIVAPFFCEANNIPMEELGENFNFVMTVETIPKLVDKGQIYYSTWL